MKTLKNSIITLTGHPPKVTEQFKNVCRNYKSVNVMNDFITDDYRALTLRLTPYSPEEEQDRYMYGDPNHEAYLCSDSYEADCKSEQHDWIKNEH